MHQEETILRYDVMKALDSGKPFNLSFVTYDEKRKTGGELRSVVNWCKVKRELDTESKNRGEGIKKSNPIYDPDHWSNATVNIYNPNNYRQHITKVHWPLITMFNGKRVIN